MIIYIVITFLVLLFCIQLRFRKTRHGVGPPLLPILGNSLDVITAKHDLLNTVFNYKQKYGKLVIVEFFPFLHYTMVSDHQVLQTIISSTEIIDKSIDYKQAYGKWMGTGLLTSDGPKWKKHRRMLTPGFHFQILDQFIEVFEKCADILCEKLEKEIGNSSFDIYPYVTLCTLDIIYESIMGVKINAQRNGSSTYVKSVKDMCRIAYEKLSSFTQRYPLLYPLSRNYYAEKKALKIIHKASSDVIKQRQKILEQQPEEESTEHCNYKKKKPFIDLLLEARIDGKPLTHQEMREEIDTFLFEGQDTTASALSFSLFCLANHEDVQKKVYDEQKKIFGDNKSPEFTYANLQKMKFLDQVIKEVLRLYPSVPMIARQPNEKSRSIHPALQNADVIGLFIYGIQRDPDYFKDPETFDPSRFDEMDGKLPFAYIPFSAGPRNCIGQKFAMMELKTVISKIIEKFVLLPSIPHHEPHLVAYTILISANGLRIRLKPRN